MMEFYKSRNFNRKKSGGNARRNEKLSRSFRNSRNDSDSRYSRNINKNESAIVTCADCGNECEIPFVPKHDRPVYCSDCFKLNKPGKFDNDRNSRNDSDSQFDNTLQSNKNNFKDSRSKKAKFLKNKKLSTLEGLKNFMPL